MLIMMNVPLLIIRLVVYHYISVSCSILPENGLTEYLSNRYHRNRKASLRADENNILRCAVDIKGKTIQAILLPKALRPWIIACKHEFSSHQGDQRSYNKIRGTFFWNGMKNDICQAMANCRVCKMESPNLGSYMNLHLEIRTAPMHFLAMDTIEIRNTRSPYRYAFMLIDILTNYVFTIPVKDISGKTLVHKYI